MFLIVLTALSLIASASCGVLAWRVLREQRRRADARVAALAAAIDGEPLLVAQGEDQLRDFHAETIATSDEPTRPIPAPLFHQDSTDAGHGHPMAKIAVGFALAVVVIVTIASMSDRPDAAAQAPIVQQHRDVPLELLAMRHAVEGHTLTVTGFVRNIADRPAADITPVVFVFDSAGSFAASGRGSVEGGTLRPGEESPFRVEVGNVNDVSRYRVSFRTEAGLVRHVDRRGEQIAAAQ